MKLAVVDSNGRITEVFDATRKSLEGKLHPDFIDLLIDVPDDAEVNWVNINDKWQPKSIKNSNSEDVTIERDNRISKGITVTLSSGKQIPVQTRNDTDFRNIQGLVSNATLFLLNNDLVTTIKFRDADDNDQFLTAPETIEMGKLVAAFVSNIYSKSWAIKDRIKNGEKFTDITNESLWS